MRHALFNRLSFGQRVFCDQVRGAQPDPLPHPVRPRQRDRGKFPRPAKARYAGAPTLKYFKHEKSRRIKRRLFMLLCKSISKRRSRA